jgi:flagellar protein FliS
VSVMMRGIDAYRRTEAQSASPLQLVVMLYDGALLFLSEARAAQATGDLRRRAAALQRVAEIIAECHATLDLEQGGSLAAELDRLYSYMSGRLLDITLKRDATAIDEVHRLVSTLRDAWAPAAGGVMPSESHAPAQAGLRP